MPEQTSAEIVCYRCGESLAALSLPLSRRDMCPRCSAHVHVCRMCANFDPAVIGQCREDEAEDVFDKERVNFCDWFSPRAAAFDPANRAEEVRARSELEALFGEAEGEKPTADSALGDAEDLFR